MVDMHLYRGDNPDGIHGSHKVFPVNDRRISFLGEFGGLGHPVDGHLWKPASGNWGYGGVEDTKTREGLEKTYLAMMDDREPCRTRTRRVDLYADDRCRNRGQRAHDLR